MAHSQTIRTFVTYISLTYTFSNMALDTTRFATLAYDSSAAVDTFFKALPTSATGFCDWFTKTQAGKDAWAGLTIAPNAATAFAGVWNKVPVILAAANPTVSPSINFAQFVALTSIMINETGGLFLPVTEKVGRKGFPGLAYAFSSIPKVKVSYNKNAGHLNRTAFDLLNDAVFVDMHIEPHLDELSDAMRNLANTTDPVWAGDVYPADTYPTSTAASDSFFLRELDFFKFRGRGIIQTTWRTNYKHIIEEVILPYKGDNAVLTDYATRWADTDPEDIATISTNDDWDALFQNTDFIIPLAAVRIHNASSGNYLALKTDTEANLRASLFKMGKSISGGNDYANLFTSRVMQILQHPDIAAALQQQTPA